MSDDQTKNELPGLEPDIKGGWHQPTEPSLWEPVEEESKPFVLWDPMPAFPEDLSERSADPGGWHLPSPEDTVLKPESTIIKGEPIIAEVEVDAPVVEGQQSPEDMINQILGLQSPPPPVKDDRLAAPEDFAIPTKKPEDVEVIAPTRPEDLTIDTSSDDEAVSDDILDADDQEDILENLEELLDGDDSDAFGEDERSALMSMMDDDEPDSSGDSDNPFQDVIKRITDEMPELTQDQIDSVETPTPPDSLGDPDENARIAAEMLAKLQAEDEEVGSGLGGLTVGGFELGEKADTSSAPQESAADIARRMAAELGDDEGNTGYSGAYGTEQYSPPPQQQIADIDPQTREIAERFRNVENQVATLNFRYQNEEMSYDEYQRMLYENMVQGEDGAWWMIGADSDKWYRHDPLTNEWTEDIPEALEALKDYEASVAAQQRGGYGSTDDFGLPPTYDSSGNTTLGDMLPPSYDNDPYGGTRQDDLGLGVPNAEYPAASNAEYTIPGPSAYEDDLPDQYSTIENEAGFEPTVISPSTDPTLYGGQTVLSPSLAGNEGIQSATDFSEPGAYSLDEPAPTVAEIKGQQQNNTIRLMIFALVGIVALGLITVIVVAVGIAFWYSNTVEPYRDQIAALASYNPPFQTARIFDANDKLIVELNSQDTGARTAISLDEMSPFVVHAVISQENERFYQDPGFDPIAIARAFFQNIIGGDIESGASTITQQIAKNLVLQDTEVTAERKINEILVALEIANQYDKNFILELYLNEVFFGNQSYGVEAASQFYFEHGADELNYAEAALLASIIPSPALNDPVVNRPTAIIGMRDTMSKMLEVGCLQFQHGDWINRGPFCVNSETQVEFEGDNVFLVRVNGQGEINGGLATLQIAEIQTAEYQPRNVRLQYPHFINFIQAEIEAEYGTNALFQRGFNIYTTLNPSVQTVAQDTLTRQVEVLVDTGINTGAVMVIDPGTGAIRAMVGSHDFSDDVSGQVNNALTYQQSGSSIKPIVYVAALIGSQGRYLTPASILWDVPVTYNVGGSTYSPVNFDRQAHGAVPLRFALQNSFNIAAVKVFEFIGNDQFIQIAQSLGLNFQEGSVVGLPSALGANEVRLFDMMEAYGTFANNGQRNELYAIQRITETVEGQEVNVPMAPRPEAAQIISPQAAFLLTNILSDDNARAEEFGVNSNLTLARLGFPSQNYVAAKTGTSNDSRDLWTMGYTRQAVVGVWLGTHDNSPTFNTTGFNSAAPVWNVVMEAALSGRRPTEYANPGGVIAQEICRTTGTLSYEGCPQRTTDLFIRDKLPPAPDQGFVQTIAIDSWTGQRANEFCDDYIIEQTFANIGDRSAVDWLNTTQAGRNYAQAVGLPIPLQAPPEGSCSQGQGLPSVSIAVPNPNSTVQGVVNVSGQVQASNLASYELGYAPAGQTTNFVSIRTSNSQVPTNGSPLGDWDTTQLSNGSYVLRLLARSTVNGQIVIDVPVTVNNPLPTPTPTALPTMVPAIVPDSTIIPVATIGAGP